MVTVAQWEANYRRLFVLFTASPGCHWDDPEAQRLMRPMTEDAWKKLGPTGQQRIEQVGQELYLASIKTS